MRARYAGRTVGGCLLAGFVLTVGLGGCSSEPNPASSVTTPGPTGAAAPTPSGTRQQASSGDAGPTGATSERPTAVTPSPAKPKEKGIQEAVLTPSDGDPTGACVNVGDSRDLRSGGILGGPFDTARATWGTKQPGTAITNVRLYWVPLHAKTMPGVKVVAVHQSSGTTVRVSQDSSGQAADWSYYDTNLQLPKAGTWQLKVSAGVDTGCFVLRLGK